MNENYFSEMKLQKVVFEELSFKRQGFKNDSLPAVTISVKTSVNESNDLYKVSLTANVIKEYEYELLVTILGLFTFGEIGDLSEEYLLNNNGVAILMPYVRSQLSLLTAQPETESLVLPVFNIQNMMKNNNPTT
jgi:preprotein translocase subunit SecB